MGVGEDCWEDRWEGGRWDGEEYGIHLSSTRAKLIQDRRSHRQYSPLRQKKYQTVCLCSLANGVAQR